MPKLGGSPSVRLPDAPVRVNPPVVFGIKAARTIDTMWLASAGTPVDPAPRSRRRHQRRPGPIALDENRAPVDRSLAA